MAVDKVLLRGIRLAASIGILNWEHEIRQPLEIDVDVDVDTTHLLSTGDLTKGVDFTVVIAALHDEARAHVDLVEMLADRMAKAILNKTPALRVRVEVRKYSACATDAHHVGVEVIRVREQG